MFSIAGGAGTGKQQNSERHCGHGEVMSILQALEPNFQHVATTPADIRIAGLGGSVNCEFRFFLPLKPSPEPLWAYCTDEVFLGGVAILDAYKLYGIKRRESVEYLGLYSSEVWFGPVGDLVERPLIRTAVKDYRDSEVGNVAWFQEAYIAQEEPGIYVNQWVLSFLNIPIFGEETFIEIVTHEEHLQRVHDGTWRNWNEDAWDF